MNVCKVRNIQHLETKIEREKHEKKRESSAENRYEFIKTNVPAVQPYCDKSSMNILHANSPLDIIL